MTGTSRELTEFEHSTSQRRLVVRSTKARVLVTLLCAVRCALAQTGPGPLHFPLDPYTPMMKQVGLSKQLWALPRAVHPQSQTGVTPAQSAIAKPTAAAPVDQRQSLYVERLKRGDDSPEVFAYLKGLRKEEITALLETSSRYNKEDQRLRQTLVATLIDRHGVSDQNLEGLSDAIVLAVGDYYRDQPDKRCVKLYEGLLAKRKTKSDGYIPELEALAQYYQKIGDAAKAAETFLRGEQYTADKPLLANFTVEAAREYMLLGDEKRANELYEGVEKHGYGWATGVMVCDRAGLLITHGKYDEAIKVLSSPVSGLYADQAKVSILYNLGYANYLKGNFDESEKYFKQSLAQYDSLPKPLPAPGEGTENLPGECKIALSWIERWRKIPIEVIPAELEIDLRTLSETKRVVKVDVLTFDLVPLEIATDVVWLHATIGSKAAYRTGFYVRRELVCEIVNSDGSKMDQGWVTLTSPSFSGVRVKLPIKVVMVKRT